MTDSKQLAIIQHVVDVVVDATTMSSLVLVLWSSTLDQWNRNELIEFMVHSVS